MLNRESNSMIAQDHGFVIDFAIPTAYVLIAVGILILVVWWIVRRGKR